MSSRRWLSLMLLVVGPLTFTPAMLHPQDDGYEVSLDLSLSAGMEDISAHWVEVPGASYYNISWTPEDNGGTDTVDGGNNKYKITGLKPCTKYTVTVQAMYDTDAGESDNATRSTKPKDSLAVSNLKVENDETNLTVLLASWTKPQPPGNCVVYYIIKWTADNIMISDEVPDISNYTIVDLTPCTTYKVGVSTRTAQNNALWKFQDGTTGSLDLSLIAELDEVSLSWNEMPGATSYNISWTPEENGGSATVNGASNTNYNISSLEKCTWYNITIQPINVNGEVFCPRRERIRTHGEESLKLSLSAGTEDITARWEEVPGASYYNISWTPEDNGGTDTVDGGSNTKYNITGLKPCTEYTVTVQAMNETGNVGCSDTSSSGTIAKDSLAVTNLMVDTVGNNKTALLASWTQPQQPGNCVVYYNISWSGGNLTMSDELPDISNYTIDDLTPCTVYMVGVATRTSGNYSLWKYKNGSTTDFGATAPESFKSASIKTKKVTLSWSEPNTTCPVASYQLSYGSTELSVTAGTHQYIVTGLKAKTEYTFYLQTVAAYGLGEKVSLTITTKVDGVAIGVGVTVGILVVVAVAVAGYIYRDKLTCLKKTKKEQII